MQFISKTLYRQGITYVFHSKFNAWGTWSLSRDLNRQHCVYVSHFELIYRQAGFVSVKLHVPHNGEQDEATSGRTQQKRRDFPRRRNAKRSQREEWTSWCVHGEDILGNNAAAKEGRLFPSSISAMETTWLVRAIKCHCSLSWSFSLLLTRQDLPSRSSHRNFLAHMAFFYKYFV